MTQPELADTPASLRRDDDTVFYSEANTSAGGMRGFRPSRPGYLESAQGLPRLFLILGKALKPALSALGVMMAIGNRAHEVCALGIQAGGWHIAINRAVHEGWRSNTTIRWRRGASR